ncbi:MAG: hypothetical protein AB1Z98_15025 [Nannocystaceae bacterium]
MTLELLVRSAGDHRVLTKVLLLEVMPTLQPEEVEDLTPRFVGLLAARPLPRTARPTAAPGSPRPRLAPRPWLECARVST